jgi:hypothetical protein
LSTGATISSAARRVTGQLLSTLRFEQFWVELGAGAVVPASADDGLGARDVEVEVDAGAAVVGEEVDLVAPHPFSASSSEASTATPTVRRWLTGTGPW